MAISISTKLKPVRVTIGIGILILSSLSTIGFSLQPENINLIMSPTPSPSPNPTVTVKAECIDTSEQTVVEWKDMYWYPCKLSWSGICIWPPFRRRHVTYKVTVNGGTPLRDEDNNPIVIAKGKIRTWEVYDSSTWGQIADSPRHLARYPDYEPITANEYVVMVETRYRLFNDVESTLRICIEP